MKLYLLTIFTLISLISCSPKKMNKVKIFEGIYTTAMEHQGFKAKGNKEEWWVDGKVEELNLKSFTPQPDGTLLAEGQAKVKVEGYLSEPGEYGHFGMWKKKITVIKVHKIERLEKSLTNGSTE